MATLPIAIWGRPDSLAPGQLRGYQLLSCSERFSVVARQELEKLARSVQWESASQNPLPDAFVAWPFGEGNLIARVQDAGLDEHDRPHALRIICALAPQEINPAWLSEDGWVELDVSTSLVHLKECAQRKQPVTSIEVNDPSGALRVSQIKHAKPRLSSEPSHQELRHCALPVGPTKLSPKIALLPALVTAVVLLAVLAWREQQARMTTEKLEQQHARQLSEMALQLNIVRQEMNTQLQITNQAKEAEAKIKNITEGLGRIQNEVWELLNLLKITRSPATSNTQGGSTSLKMGKTAPSSGMK